jgi:hypothetical protein
MEINNINQSKYFNNIVSVLQDEFQKIAWTIERFDFSNYSNADITKILLDQYGLSYSQYLNLEQNQRILEGIVPWLKTRSTARALKSLIRHENPSSAPEVYEPFSDTFRVSINSLSGKGATLDADYWRPGTYEVTVEKDSSWVDWIIRNQVPVGQKFYKLINISNYLEPDLNNAEIFNYLDIKKNLSLSFINDISVDIKTSIEDIAAYEYLQKLNDNLVAEVYHSSFHLSDSWLSGPATLAMFLSTVEIYAGTLILIYSCFTDYVTTLLASSVIPISEVADYNIVIGIPIGEIGYCFTSPYTIVNYISTIEEEPDFSEIVDYAFFHVFAFNMSDFKIEDVAGTDSNVLELSGDAELSSNFVLNSTSGERTLVYEYFGVPYDTLYFQTNVELSNNIGNLVFDEYYTKQMLGKLFGFIEYANEVFADVLNMSSDEPLSGELPLMPLLGEIEINFSYLTIIPLHV